METTTTVRQKQPIQKFAIVLSLMRHRNNNDHSATVQAAIEPEMQSRSHSSPEHQPLNTSNLQSAFARSHSNPIKANPLPRQICKLQLTMPNYVQKQMSATATTITSQHYGSVTPPHPTPTPISHLHLHLPLPLLGFLNLKL